MFVMTTKQATRFSILLAGLAFYQHSSAANSTPQLIGDGNAASNNIVQYYTCMEPRSGQQMTYFVSNGKAMLEDMIIGDHDIIQQTGVCPLAVGPATTSKNTRKRRAAPDTTATLWPNGIVYYSLAQATDNTKKVFQEAIDHIESHTAIRFVERTNEPDYIEVITSGYGCRGRAEVGMRGKQQLLELGDNCPNMGTALHELGHVLGFHHEHQRPDRDAHVRVEENNPNNYGIEHSVDINSSPYDVESIMGYRTSRILDPTKRHLYIKDKLSKGDIAAWNARYPGGPGRIRPTRFSPTSVSPKKVIIEQSKPATVTILRGNRQIFNIDVIKHSSMAYAYRVPSPDNDGNYQYVITPYSGAHGTDELKLRLIFGTGDTQEITLPIQVSNPLPGRPTRPSVARRRLVSRNGMKCLEVLDEGYSWFWKNRERTVGMRNCRADAPEQYWKHKTDGTIINEAYPNMCLGKAQWNSAKPVKDDKRSHVALQQCNGLDNQKWIVDENLIKNKADQSLALMQGNGTVVVEHGASSGMDRYLWDWR